jgi:dipeptidyl aminopeptidase/acylaminoacyl peptidase
MNKAIVLALFISGFIGALPQTSFAQSDDSFGAFGIKRLAYVTGPGSFFSPHEDLWIVDTPKSKPRRLAEGIVAVWSPDGQKIAYCAHEGWGTKHIVFGQVQLINADGSGHAQLTNIPGGACPVDWSADGKKIASTAGALILDSKGLGVANVLPGVRGLWSPDGSKLAFSKYRESAESSGSIWVANGDGTNPKKVIDDNSEMIRLCWSPDGESILFSSRRENKKQSEILRVKLDGTALQKVATDKKLSLVGPSISPDGRYLVVAAYGNAPEASILLIDLSNQNRTVLAHGIQAEPSILWDKH